MTNEARYPEPENFEQTLDDYVPKAVDAVFLPLTQHPDDRVRAWSQRIDLDGLRVSVGRLMAHQIRCTAAAFYQTGYHHGAIRRIRASGTGERSLVSYDEKGRIKEMVKTPLSVQERLDLEKVPDKG